MTSLLDAARARVAKRGPACAVGLLRERYPARAKEIDELLASSGPSKSIPYSVAAQTLTEAFTEGPEFKGDTVSRHCRRGTAGGCKCPS